MCADKVNYSNVVRGREIPKVDRLAHLNNPSQKSTTTKEASPRTQMISFAIVMALFVGFYFTMCGGGDGDIKDKSMVYNSVLDASVYQVEQYLEKTLKEPDSYESIEWSKVVRLNNGDFTVRHKYRAKNSFGGYVVSNKVFTLDEDGDIISTVDY